LQTEEEKKDKNHEEIKEGKKSKDSVPSHWRVI